MKGIMASTKYYLFFILSMSLLNSDVNNVIAAAASVSGHHCEHDKKWFSFENYCYQPIANSKDWKSAQNVCTSMEAHLTSIHSEMESKFIMDLIKSHSNIRGDKIWIGLHVLTADDEFEWNDGSDLDYTYWHERSSGSYAIRYENEEEEEKEECVQFMAKTGYWNVASCDEKNEFVCKKLKPIRMGEHHPRDHSKGLTTWTIIGIVLGSVFLLLIISVIGYVYIRPWVTSHVLKQPIK